MTAWGKGNSLPLPGNFLARLPGNVGADYFGALNSSVIRYVVEMVPTWAAAVELHRPEIWFSVSVPERPTPASKRTALLVARRYLARQSDRG